MHSNDMQINKRILALQIIAAIFMTGCVGPMVKIETVDPKIAQSVQIYTDASILQKSGVKSIGVITATSCRNQAWEPPASIENCTAQMQMRAARLGANGLILGSSDRQVANFISTGVNRNCWSTVDCSGIVIITSEEITDKK